MLDDPWGMFVLFAIGAVLGIPFIFWAGSRLGKVNQEIEKLERKRKEVRNSVR